VSAKARLCQGENVPDVEHTDSFANRHIVPTIPISDTTSGGVIDDCRLRAWGTAVLQEPSVFIEIGAGLSSDGIGWGSRVASRSFGEEFGTACTS
jgi:hypothetical protein